MTSLRTQAMFNLAKLFCINCGNSRTKLRITKVKPLFRLLSAEFQLFYSIRRLNLNHGKTDVRYSTASQHRSGKVHHRLLYFGTPFVRNLAKIMEIAAQKGTF
jgi:hypothetical protein